MRVCVLRGKPRLRYSVAAGAGKSMGPTPAHMTAGHITCSIHLQRPLKEEGKTGAHPGPARFLPAPRRPRRRRCPARGAERVAAPPAHMAARPVQNSAVAQHMSPMKTAHTRMRTATSAGWLHVAMKSRNTWHAAPKSPGFKLTVGVPAAVCALHEISSASTQPACGHKEGKTGFVIAPNTRSKQHACCNSDQMTTRPRQSSKVTAT